ncbi:MAG: GTP cyclohydrolase II [Alphaproteobacteria bacterium]|nr:GTP cyclohydrolase II [Alphaproteobacteria bacterium]
MNKDFFNQIIFFHQSANDLSNGIPINIKYSESSYIILGLSAITENDFYKLSEFYKPKYLVLSKYRAKYLGIETSENLLIDIHNKSFDEITDISGISYKTVTLENFNTDDNFFNHLIYLASNLEIVPCFLLFEADDENLYRNYESLLIDFDDENLQNNFREISRSPLKLRNIDVPVEMVAFKSNFASKEHYAIIIGDGAKADTPLVRLHSACYTGDLFASITCDCYDQLHSAISKMAECGGGIIMYLMQEGRGIGLSNKLRCYHLQNNGLDTVDANLAMGFPDDVRIMWPAAAMLKIFGISKVNLLTNNPKKTQDLEKYGIIVESTVKHVAHTNSETDSYMEVKAKKMGHTL